MTETEIKKQHDHDDTMRRLREKFAVSVWPGIVIEMGHRYTGHPSVRQAAWLGFVAGKRVRT